MDTIIQYAPRRSLMALRATSRHYRDQADALLCSHVMFRNRLVLSHLEAPGYQGPIPGLRFSSSASEQNRCLELLKKHCRVVDYYRLIPLKDWELEVLEPALDGVRLVRRWGDFMICGLMAPTVLDFLFLVPRSLPDAWFSELHVGIGPIVKRTTTRIVSIIYHPYYPRLADCQLYVGCLAPSLERAVIIFTPRTDGLPPPPASAPNRPQHRLGLLHGIVCAIASRLPDLKVTLVGIDELDLLCLGEIGTALRNDSSLSRDDAIYEAIEERWAQCYPHSRDGMRVRDNVEFITRDEYRSRVGDKEYELHTVPD